MSLRLALATLLLLTAASAGNADDVAKRANRLIDANSPYLLAHARNPVDWYPWGPEALEKARREDKPIFLSVGYSTCYWCHVAERTIYSNPEIAGLMNAWFVNIKVDREQRPDIDALYLLASRLLTGRGGWPNNVFLTPDLRPFFAGSFFPPEDDDFGRPGFPRVLKTLHDDWTLRRADMERQADAVVEAMKETQRDGTDATAAVPPAEWLARARDALMHSVDARHGGFADGDTKFPNAPAIGLLLAAGDAHARAAVQRSLDAMAFGGIHDHIGGGLHRYSVEPTWSIPHFEKMLYDNAQMLALYARAWRATHDPLYRYMADDIAAYVGRRLTAPDGGFYAAEDAETDGREGASYVWRKSEIEAILGRKAARRFFRVYALTPLPERADSELPDDDAPGVLRLRPSPGSRSATAGKLAALAPARAQLLAARAQRTQPRRDEKIVVAWNALMIESLADAGRILGRPDLVAAAARAAQRLWAQAFDPASGELKHELFRNRAQIPGYLDDYALFGIALLAVGEATRESLWQRHAAGIAAAMLGHFRQGATLKTTRTGGELPLAPPDTGDSVMPSGRSAALILLLRLAAATNDSGYGAAAAGLLAHAPFARRPERWPAAVAALYRFPPSTTNAPPSSADYVHAHGEIRRTPAGDEIVVTLDIAPGYRINANPAGFDYLIPTTVAFKGMPGIEPSYPAAQIVKPRFAPAGIMAYRATTVITGRLPAAADRTAVYEAEIGLQACGDDICLPPATLTVAIPTDG